MIELNDDNDPNLFAISLPSGRIVMQYMEALVALRAICPEGRDPTIAETAQAIRESSRTKATALVATDGELFAAWHRMHAKVTELGNDSGRPRAS
jgi:hypothetical protein